MTKNRIQPSAVETIGLRGERRYSYETVSDAQTLLPELLEYETDGTEREALRAARHAKGDCP